MIKPIKGGKSLAERLAADEAEQTNIASDEQKPDLPDKEDKKEVVKKNIKNNDITKLISNKLDAMEKWNLTAETNGVNAPLEGDDDFYFSAIAKKIKKKKKYLAVQYILECLIRDLNNGIYNIPFSKEYLEEAKERLDKIKLKK